MKDLRCLYVTAYLFGITLFANAFGTDSLEQKVGELIIAPACPKRADEQHLLDLKNSIQSRHIGGFLMKQGSLEETSKMIALLHQLSPKPLLITADAEWGMSMRISDAVRYPRNMTLGAISDLDLLEEMGEEIGQQMKVLGFHLNFSPVVDVNSNPKNPIIKTRSFGDDPLQVSARGSAMMRGLQKAGIMACAKHFPGHGDTYVDSHKALPQIGRGKQELLDVELRPFQTLIDDGVAAVMTAHLMIPQVDEVPVTFSRKWVTDILQEELGFTGLIITDALNMQGIAKGRDAGEVAVLAFLAGHDLLLYGDHIAPNIDDILEVQIPQAIEALKKAVQEGIIAEEEIDRRVAKIRKAKEFAQLASVAEVTTTKLPAKLFAKALTKIGEIPNLTEVSLLELGEPRGIGELLMSKGIEVTKEAAYTLVIMGEGDRFPDEVNISSAIVMLFGSPYALEKIPAGVPVLLGYEEAPEAWEAAAAALAGKIPCPGSLPIKKEVPPSS